MDPNWGAGKVPCPWLPGRIHKSHMGKMPHVIILFPNLSSVMKNKFNRTGLVLTGAAVLVVGLAGNIQAVPASASEIAASATDGAQELRLEAESVARRTAAGLSLCPIYSRPSSALDCGQRQGVRAGAA